jgi:hypothetical protein
MAAKQVVAVEPFALEVNGRAVQVHQGDVYDASHPVVKAVKGLFKPRESHGVTQPAPAKQAAKK